MTKHLKLFILLLLILSDTNAFELGVAYEEEVKSTYSAFVKSFESKSLEKLLSFIDYSPEATMLLGTTLLTGEEIRTYYVDTFSNLSTVDEMLIENMTVTKINQTVCLLHCNFKESLTLKNGYSYTYEGAALYYFEKVNNNWIIKHSSGAVKCQ